jgi:WD40 repeat protein
MLASGSYDKTIRLWDLASHACVATLTGHSLCVMSVAFSPDGRLLASGSTDNTIRLWDVTSHTCVAVLSDHTKTVLSVAFSPDGCTLVSGSDDGTVRLWDVASRSCTSVLTGHKHSVLAVAFSPVVRAISIMCLFSSICGLQLPHWSREEHHLFPAEFRAAVRQLVRGHYSTRSMLNTLPMDVLELVIGHLARDPYSFATVPALSP